VTNRKVYKPGLVKDVMGLQAIFGRNKKLEQPKMNYLDIKNQIPQLYKFIAKNGVNQQTFVKDMAELAEAEDPIAPCIYAPWFVNVIISGRELTEGDKNMRDLIAAGIFKTFNAKLAKGIVAYLDNVAKAISRYDIQRGTKLAEKFADARAIGKSGSTEQVHGLRFSSPVYWGRQMVQSEFDRLSPEQKDIRTEFGAQFDIFGNIVAIRQAGEYYNKLFSEQPKAVDSPLR